MRTIQPILFSLLFLLLVPVSVQAQLPFTEDFESGDFIEGEWTLSGNIQISTQEPASGIYCAQAEGQFGLYRVFSHPSDTLLTLEFTTKVGQTNTTALIFRIKDGLQAAAGTGMGLILRNTGELIGLDGTSQIALLAYEPNHWYHLKIVLHMRSRTYDVYIDDVLAAEAYRFYSSNFTRPALFTWSSLENISTFFLDDIKLYAGDGSVGVQQRALSAEKIKLYPNPAKDVVWIDGPAGPSLNCRITNLLGQAVSIQPFIANQPMSLKQLPAGAYLISLYEGDRLFATEKLILE